MDMNKLQEAGVDVPDLMNRLMGNEALVNRFFKRLIEDDNIDKLRDAVAKGDMQEALSYSHALKGMTGNLSLTSLFNLFSEQVSLIRTGIYSKAALMMPEISEEYDKTINALKEIIE